MIYIVLSMVCGVIGVFVARSKNLNPVLWGAICFFTGIIGLLILTFMRSKASPIALDDARAGDADELLPCQGKSTTAESPDKTTDL